ncbi:MAG: GspH/FimT family pseudopilin [Candidatus Competibacteraceae bacterium]|nr:GspH/FimT family pseudopilin [Candidatus Competibacteraceae bacterium]
MKRQQMGLTLIELMVTLAVTMTLLGAGTPGIRSLLDNNRLTAQANALYADLLYARSQAVRRGATVRVVARDGDWNQGWDVVDARVEEDHPARLIKAGELPQPGLYISADDQVLEVDYRHSGTLAGRAMVTLSLCTDSGRGRRITVQLIGRVGLEPIADCREPSAGIPG